MSEKTDKRKQRVDLLAPAKINLYLHITGRRADGYHMLDSLVAFADIGDAVSVVRSARQTDGLVFDRRGPFADALPVDGEKDLVSRAAAALLDATGISGSGLSIELQKNLPVAAGIGGGSADAAATLRGLMVLLDAPGTTSDLAARLALRLGADVPVCLTCEPTVMRGIGETLRPVRALAELGIVLVNPRVALGTPTVFAGYATSGAAFRAPVEVAGEIWSQADACLTHLREQNNDLTPAATAALPVIGDMLAVLEAGEGCRVARMSGSGATCFGLFADETVARRACATLSTAHSDWWWAAGRLLKAAPQPVLSDR
ncbi:MAG: 4-(cytidine 5'-diphospho)-2-C-methyl-D-erythritol kinase [Alphaproteobacteria bacterium]|nr:4-(cytidine 5'-diphospho)-2-C-methyl-D-erythritol kinase [Alphaproteobacteria bacterium]